MGSRSKWDIILDNDIGLQGHEKWGNTGIRAAWLQLCVIVVAAN